LDTRMLNGFKIHAVGTDRFGPIYFFEAASSFFCSFSQSFSSSSVLDS
jgi:hypothetical protein